MNIRILWGVMLAGLLGVTGANAECLYPKAPDNSPNGATATEEEMIAGMQAIKAYNSEVNAYLSCLEMEMNARIEAAGADASKSQIASIRAIHSKRHNAAVEELEAHAARFNEQVQAYKARPKS
ncbi:hypothetical protein ACG33_02305 [Steroidobacter denitrificans]|uniref:Uncharacterized protein n=1 Tax=Steroidobacter denitrificans TaxID=465721 RepID=A0A127F680_STEDE|nr:hypothetical protein [Steroidobacter denitrificans]AMN45962.1 hypothetical protein ACG33_02305 [Steroidobacter denitrificans]